MKHMKNRKSLYVILCALGGGLIGLSVNQLNEIYGCIIFGIGIGLMIYSIINIYCFSYVFVCICL